MNEFILGYSYSGILQSNKNNWVTTMCNNLNKSEWREFCIMARKLLNLYLLWCISSGSVLSGRKVTKDYMRIGGQPFSVLCTEDFIFRVLNSFVPCGCSGRYLNSLLFRGDYFLSFPVPYCCCTYWPTCLCL